MLQLVADIKGVIGGRGTGLWRAIGGCATEILGNDFLFYVAVIVVAIRRLSGLYITSGLDRGKLIEIIVDVSFTAAITVL